jgi:hypothetical protein
MAGIGWTLFDAQPGLDVQPIPTSKQRAKRMVPRLGVVATPHGASFGASSEF